RNSNNQLIAISPWPFILRSVPPTHGIEKESLAGYFRKVSILILRIHTSTSAISCSGTLSSSNMLLFEPELLKEGFYHVRGSTHPEHLRFSAGRRNQNVPCYALCSPSRRCWSDGHHRCCRHRIGKHPHGARN